MFNSQSRRPRWKATTSGALGFALAFGVLTALLAGLNQRLPLPDYPSWSLVLLIGFAVTGAVGGVELGWGHSRRMALLATAGAVGMALAYVLMQVSSQLLLNAGQALAGSALQAVLMGAAFGGALGVAQRNTRQ